MLQFALAVLDDETFLYELYAGTRREELSMLNWPEEQQNAFLRMQFDAQRRSYRYQYPELRQEIVILGNSRIGQLCTAASEQALVLADVTLLPQFCNQGIGTRIISGLQQSARSQGLGMRLHVLQQNRARRLYERMGFRVTGEQFPYMSMAWDETDRSRADFNEGGE